MSRIKQVLSRFVKEALCVCTPPLTPFDLDAYEARMRERIEKHKEEEWRRRALADVKCPPRPLPLKGDPLSPSRSPK